MRIGVIERFADASRRSEPSAIGASDEGVVWSLPGPFHDPGSFVRSIPAGLWSWLAEPLSPGDRWKLLRASLSTGGARLGALVRAPELLRRVRAGEVDRIGCFSAKNFGLATHLASELGAPCRETLERQTQYFGEFGFELLAVVPYAYWLHQQGRLERTVGGKDTRCLYYFSPDHEERPVPRHYVPISEYPVGEGGVLRYDRKTFPASLDTRCWFPPPYKKVYRDDRFRWSKEPCVVCNKLTDEHYLWHHSPTNFLRTELALRIIGRLRSRYQVIYSRPRAEDIVNDHQTIRETGDIEAVKRAYPDVITIQELGARHPSLSFNELQLRLFAGCRRFVSVLGGGAYLASYFGGTNVVFARRGWEVACRAYDNWFDRFSGARVVAAGDARALVRAIDRELLG